MAQVVPAADAAVLVAVVLQAEPAAAVPVAQPVVAVVSAKYAENSA